MITNWAVVQDTQDLLKSLQKDSGQTIESVDDDGKEFQWQEHYAKLLGVDCYQCG